MTSTGVPGDTYTLAWYCVQLLIDTIRELSPPPCTTPQIPKGKGKAQETVEVNNDTKTADDRTHRLSLMLISTISSLPMAIMLRALDEIRIIITAYSHSRSRDDSGVDDGNKDEASESGRKGRKKELLEALFSEILNNMGDREKEGAIKWWYRYRPLLVLETGERGQEGALGTVPLKRRKGVEKTKDVSAGEREENPSPALSRL